MLDKSVPYAGFYMCRRPGAPEVAFKLPDGFKFSFYDDGDEASWARIETSVLEFDSEFEALLHFNRMFKPYPDELRRRCIFVENDENVKIATATAWWSEIEGERRARLQWVAVAPQYQGLGLGKAIVTRVTEIMTEIEGEVPFYLSTQTWSYKAVNIYLAHGYEPTAEKAWYNNRRDNYKKAMRILKRHRLLRDE